MTLDQYLITLNAIHKNMGIQEMERELGVSRQIVQRLLTRLYQEGYYTAEFGPSGRKVKNRSRKLTQNGYTLLRGHKYDV